MVDDIPMANGLGGRFVLVYFLLYSFAFALPVLTWFCRFLACMFPLLLLVLISCIFSTSIAKDVQQAVLVVCIP